MVRLHLFHQHDLGILLFHSLPLAQTVLVVPMYKKYIKNMLCSWLSIGWDLNVLEWKHHKLNEWSSGLLFSQMSKFSASSIPNFHGENKLLSNEQVFSFMVFLISMVITSYFLMRHTHLFTLTQLSRLQSNQSLFLLLNSACLEE